MKDKFKKHLLPFVAITGIFSLVYFFFHGFRFADPDQYFHFAVSRHFAESWDLFHLPQVKGMAWDEAFSDKEFLFHLFTGVAYKFAGPAGVLYACFAFALSILLMIYAITFRLTKNIAVSIMAAVLPLFLETYILKIMVVRAFLPTVAIVLLMIYCLLSGRKKGVLLSGMLFSLTYHVLPLPVLVLIVWATTQWFLGERRDRMIFYGLAGLALGMLINPYFPSNIVMMMTHIHVALAQFQPSGLDYGPEQMPYRTDNFLKLFRFAFVFLGLGLGVLWLHFRGSTLLDKRSDDFEKQYFFVGALSFVFFLLMFLSPRFQEYAVPVFAIYAAMSVLYFKNFKLVASGLLIFMAIVQIAARPLAHFPATVAAFKQFDNSYFMMVKDIPAPAYVFNCDWWGGHYVMNLRPDLQTMDVLDPSLLRSRSEVMFQTVSSLRQGRVSDPYHLLSNILKVTHVLCSSRSPVNSQFLVDPRFQKLQQGTNAQEELYLYKLREPDLVGSLSSFESRTGSNEWQRLERRQSDPSLVYVDFGGQTDCVDLRPIPEEIEKMAPYSFFALSGTGDVIIYQDSKVYLNRTPLPEALRWGEVLVPIRPGANWVFKICPDKRGQASLGVFLLSHHQQNLYCETTIQKLDPNAKNVKTEFAGFELPVDRCATARVK